MSENQQPHRGEVVRDRVANPFGTAQPVAKVNGALISAEQQRAIAEVQARILIAKGTPRDPVRAMDAIIQECMRPSLAERAEYQYGRGGTDISGASIRLVEAIARNWGNLSSGIKELYRNREEHYSECVAYAWDLETGYHDERQFQVRHWRDTQKGGYVLTDERDIYELMMNFGQRRKRACLLAVLPGDVVEAAIEQCHETLTQSADITPESLKKMLARFAEFNVSQRHIEKRIQRRLDSISPAQFVQLRRIYTSLKDQMSEPADWFRDTDPQPETKSETKPAPKPVKDAEVKQTVQKEDDKPVTKKPVQPERPKATEPDRPEVEFESYLCDASGEAINGEIFTDPREWIENYRATLADAFPADIEKIVENNTAAIEFIIQNYPELAREANLDTTGSTPAEPSEQKEVTYKAVEVPTRGPAGQRDLQGYIDAAVASLQAEVVDPTSLKQWLARNKATTNTMPVTVQKAIQDAIDTLGMALSSQPEWPVKST